MHPSEDDPNINTKNSSIISKSMKVMEKNTVHFNIFYIKNLHIHKLWILLLFLKLFLSLVLLIQMRKYSDLIGVIIMKKCFLFHKSEFYIKQVELNKYIC